MSQDANFHYTVDELVSGLRVVRVPMPSATSVTVLALVNTGSRYEEASQYGIAHFFEHIVFKGTKLYPSAQKLSSTVDGIGADYNAYTSKEYTGYYVKAASHQYKTALSVVSQMLMDPLIKEEDVEREKGVIIEEINMYEDTPMRNVDTLFEDMMYSGSGLGHPIIGTKETVSSVTAKELKNFITHWYGLDNIVLTVAGDASVVGSDGLFEEIQTVFKHADKRKSKARDEVTQSLNAQPSSASRLIVQDKKTEQAHLQIAWPSLHRKDDRRYTQHVLSVILGGNMSSRLFTEVREKRGLCYYVSASPDYFHDAGHFSVVAGVDPQRVHEALQVITAECFDLATGKQPITAEELTRAQEFSTGSMLLGLEDSSSVAQYWGMRLLLNSEIQTPAEALAKIRAVTLADVQQLAADVFKEGTQRLAIIGPFADASVFEKYLG